MGEKAQDYRTTVSITRWKLMPDGNYREVKTTDSFYLHEAYVAGWIGPNSQNKDNWLFHPKAMTYARCFNRVSNVQSC